MAPRTVAAPSPSEALTHFSPDPLRSRSMPGVYYYDPNIFEREKRAIFHRTWQYVGHHSMLPAPGSYIVREVADQSVLLLRDRQGELRAFFNVCQHRAHRLLEGEGKFNAALITCPYHAGLRSRRRAQGRAWQREDGRVRQIGLRARAGPARFLPGISLRQSRRPGTALLGDGWRACG